MSSSWKPSRLLLPLALLAVLLAAAPARPARAADPIPDWVAATVRADFSTAPFQVSYTVYAGKNSAVAPGVYTATILKSVTADITGTCVVQGSLGAPDAGGYVAFNGATRVRCSAPGINTLWAQLYPTLPGLAGSLSCPTAVDAGPTPGHVAPLAGSADVRLSTGSYQNPVISAPSLGVTLSVPANLSLARTRLDLSGGPVMSGPWSIGAAGNQVLLGGINGPGIVASDARFGWYSYLSGWKPAYSAIFGQQLRHWYQSPGGASNVGSVPSTYMISTSSHDLYIGYNPGTGQYFTGSLRAALVDPGCPIS